MAVPEVSSAVANYATGVAFVKEVRGKRGLTEEEWNDARPTEQSISGVSVVRAGKNGMMV